MGTKEQFDELVRQVGELTRECNDLRIAQQGQIIQEANNTSVLDDVRRRVERTSFANFSEFELPVYDSSFISPSSFLRQAEEFLTWRNAPKSSWLVLVPKFFKEDSDLRRWWNATRPSVSDWDGFKSEFRAYEAGHSSKDKLYEILFAKKQKPEEAFETYVWDIHSLYKRVDRSASTDVIIDRVLHSCIPEVSIHIPKDSVGSIAELAVRSRAVIRDLNKLRELEGKSLFRAGQSDPIPVVTSKEHSASDNKVNSSNQGRYHRSTNFHNGHTSKSSEPNRHPKPQRYCSFHKSSSHNTEDCREKQYANRSNNASGNNSHIQQSTSNPTTHPKPNEQQKNQQSS